MTERAKKRLIWLFVAAVVAFILLMNADGALTIQQDTPPVYITLPTEPELNKDDPNFVSPYKADESYVGMVVKVWKESLVVDGVSITTNNTDNHTNSVDVEDVVSVTLRRQSLNSDVNQAKLVIVTNNNMKDPYTTPIQQYTSFCESIFEQNENGTWTAKFMLGYSKEQYNNISLLFVYDGEIEYFSALRVTQHHIYSKMYYQWLTPKETVAEFHLVENDIPFATYCFYPSRVNTLSEWIADNTNHDKWQAVQTLITNADATWYINAEDINKPLTDGMTIEVHKVSNNQLPLSETQLNAHSTQYITSWLHKSQEDVIAHFGQPQYSSNTSSLVKLDYHDLRFYIHPEKGVIQIDVKPGYQELPPQLPTQKCTGDILTAHLRSSVIPYIDFISNSNADAQFYSHRLTIDAHDCFISYMWEGESFINPNYEEFTRIVIHSGEEYIY